ALSIGAGKMNPQKLMTSIVGGAPPDLIVQDRFTVGDWASRGTFMALDPFLAKETGPDAVRRESFYPAAWNEAVYQGKVYAIPTGIDDRMLMWNKDVFRDAGLDPEKPPRTWEELREMARKINARNPDGTFKRIGYIPHLATYGNSWYYIYSFMNGGSFMTADGKTCTLDAKENVEALQFLVQLYEDAGGYNAVNVFSSGFQGGEQDPFFLGKIGMVVHGSWVIPNIARYKPDLDFGVAPPPVPAARVRGEGRFAGMDPEMTWTGGFSFAIPVGAAHPDVAWRFLRYMQSEEAYRLFNREQKKYNERIGRPFVFNLTANEKINRMLLREFPPALDRLREAQRAYIDILPKANYRPVTFVGQTLWDAHVRAMELAALGRMTPEEALRNQQLVVQKALDKAERRNRLPLFDATVPALVCGGLILLGAGFAVVRGHRVVRHSRMARSEALAGLLMAGPWIVGFLLLTLGPILASAMLAFCDYDVLHAPRANGFENFRELFTDDRELLFKALGNVAYNAAIGIPLGMTTGLCIALLLNQKVKGMNYYRTAFYVPSIVPAIASAVLWMWVLAGDPNKGLLNALWKQTITQWFGIVPPGWFGVPEWSKPGLIIQGLWGAGGGMILWLAGLQGIPASLSEAASIDGAGTLSRFRNVTLPLLSPYIFFNLIMGTIGAIQEFDRVYVMAGGEGGSGPGDSLLMPVLLLFNNAFRYFKMGYASALAWVIFVIILLLTMIQWSGQRRWVHYEGDAR
ncbi:MAG: extracellular solute-binding protein, partial [Armatimonadota bacterium]